MKKSQLALLACLISLGANAQTQENRMTREELLTFLPGAKVKHISKGGSERRWTNNADGTLYANTDNKTYGSATGSLTAASRGTWSVSEEGRYCIDIEWKRHPENWCSHILRGEGDTYYLGTVDEKRKIEFTK